MDKLDFSITDLPEGDFQFKLTITLGSSQTYYFGVGVVGCPEGAQWFDPLDGQPMMPELGSVVRAVLRARSEAVLSAVRQAAMQALLEG